MTLKDWIKNNLTTENYGGEAVVVFTHPQKNCGVCGRDHPEPKEARTERIPVKDLSAFGNYASVYKNNNPPGPALADESIANGSGHERYFNQA